MLTIGTRSASNNDLAIRKAISQSITSFYSSAEGKESLPSKTGENLRTSSYHNVQVGAVRLPSPKLNSSSRCRSYPFSFPP